MNTELNAPIPTNIEKILQISYYIENPVEHTILQTYIRTYHIISSATKLNFGQFYNY